MLPNTEFNTNISATWIFIDSYEKENPFKSPPGNSVPCKSYDALLAAQFPDRAALSWPLGAVLSVLHLLGHLASSCLSLAFW